MSEGASDLVWCALANPIRRGMLDRLRRRAATTGELAEAFPAISRFAVMQHLEVLVEAGLVVVRREGRHRYNYLNAAPLREAYERWVSRFAELESAGALALKRYVEESMAEPVVVETEVRLKAQPERVFAAFTGELDRWWAFRVKPSSRVVFEAWPGGRILEDWGGGNGVLYGTVVQLDAPRKLVSRGGLDQAWTAVNTEEAIPDGDGTIYRKRLVLWGEVPEEQARMFQQGTRAIAEQLIKRYVEEGSGYTPPSGGEA